MLTRSDVNVLSKNLPGFRGEVWHILVDGDYFVVSGAITSDASPETMVFPADSRGRVTDWMDVVSYHPIDHEATIRLLLEELNRLPGVVDDLIADALRTEAGDA